VYRLTSPKGLLWRDWGDDAVVYNPASGNTHRLPAPAAHVLRSLQAQPASVDDLVAELTAWVPERQSDLRAWVSALLGELERVGLVESL